LKDAPQVLLHEQSTPTSPGTDGSRSAVAGIQTIFNLSD